MTTYYESNNSSATRYSTTVGSYGGSQDFRAGQIFVPAISHSFGSAKIDICRNTDFPSGILTANVYETDANDEPSGGSLASGSVNVNSIAVYPNEEWVEVFFGRAIEVVAGTKYILVFSGEHHDSSSEVLSAFFTIDNGYPDGFARFINNITGNWINLANSDFLFFNYKKFTPGVNYERRSDYDEDGFWDPQDEDWDASDAAGGGRYKVNLITVSYNNIYFGEV